MKKLITITISFFAFTLAGCNFYTDVDADWNADEGEQSSECDELLVLLNAEDNEGRRAELAAEYSRCAGVDPDAESPDRENPDNPGDCESADGEDCGDHDPGNPPCTEGADCDVDQIDCQQVEVWVSGHTAEDALHFCEDLNLSDVQCHEIVSQCLGEDWTPGVNPDGTPSNDPICEFAYDQLNQANIDPDSLTSAQAYDLCVQTAMDGTQNGMVDESMCQEVAELCFGDGSETPPNGGGDTCASLIQQASDLGVQPPQTDEEAHDVYNQCLQVSQDEGICDQLIACYGFMP